MKKSKKIAKKLAARRDDYEIVSKVPSRHEYHKPGSQNLKK